MLYQMQTGSGQPPACMCASTCVNESLDLYSPECPTDNTVLRKYVILPGSVMPQTPISMIVMQRESHKSRTFETSPRACAQQQGNWMRLAK